MYINFKMKGIMLLVTFALTILISVVVLQLAWNSSMPKIFPGVGKVSFLSAMGLLIVSSILFSRTILI